MLAWFVELLEVGYSIWFIVWELRGATEHYYIFWVLKFVVIGIQILVVFKGLRTLYLHRRWQDGVRMDFRSQFVNTAMAKFDWRQPVHLYDMLEKYVLKKLQEETTPLYVDP